MKLTNGEQAEVEIPVYQALRKNGDLADRMLQRARLCADSKVGLS